MREILQHTRDLQKRPLTVPIISELLTARAGGEIFRRPPTTEPNPRPQMKVQAPDIDLRLLVGQYARLRSLGHRMSTSFIPRGVLNGDGRG